MICSSVNLFFMACAPSFKGSILHKPLNCFGPFFGFQVKSDMAPDHHESTLIERIAQELVSTNPDGMRQMLEALLNTIMKIERNQTLQAEPYERSEERQGYANGYKEKVLQTRMGSLSLNVPKARGIEFYPKCLERGSRSERALKLAVAEMYLKGISMRRIEAVTKELCGLEISSTQVSRATQLLEEDLAAFREGPLSEMPYLFLDATYLKVRHGGVRTEHGLFGCIWSGSRWPQTCLRSFNESL